MSIPRYSVRHPVVVNMIIISVMIAGFVIYFGIPGIMHHPMIREVFPEVSADIVKVTTIFPGASPEEVESLITVPIEDELDGLDGIDRYESISIDSRSEIYVFVETDGDVAKVLRDVERAVDRAKPDLPDDAEEPDVDDLEFERAVIVAVITGTADAETVRRLADHLEDRFEAISGVSSVVKAGLRDPEIRIEPRPDRLAALGISTDEIIRAVAMADRSLPAGTIETASGEAMIRVTGDIETTDEIGDLVVRWGPGGPIRVRDIADVRDTFEDETTRGRVDGGPSVTLAVRKKRDGDTIRIADEVFRILDEEEELLPPGLSLTTVQDTSYWIRRRIRVLETNGLFGLVFVLFILYLFMNGRMAAIVALGIPVAFATAFCVMHIWGITANMLSLFSLILALGMIVDDAIIVSENMFSRVEKGEDPGEAAVNGTEEVFWPVLGAVSTTVAAFLPLAFMGGMMGKFTRVIPEVVTIALIASLIEAILTLPSHLAEFIRVENGKRGRGRAFWNDRIRVPFRRWFAYRRRVYRRRLAWLLRRRYIVVPFFILITIITIILPFTPLMKFELFPMTDVEFVFIKVEAPVGSSIDETTGIAIEIENRLREGLRPEWIESLSTTVGIVRDEGDNLSVEYGTHLAQIAIDIENDYIQDGDEIMPAVRASVAGFEGARVTVQKLRPGPPVGKPVSIRLSAPRLETIVPAADEVRGYLEGLPGVVDVRTSLEVGKEEYRVVIDRTRAASVGLDVTTVATRLRHLFSGGEATEVRRGGDDVKIVVRAPEDEGDRLSTLENLRLVSPVTHEVVPLSSIAGIVRGRGYQRLRRYNGEAVIFVTADVEGITSAEVNARAARELAGLTDRYRDVSMRFGGEEEDTEESMINLAKAAAVAILIIYTILVMEFNSFGQPIIIMFTIPFAVTGVVLGLAANMQPLSFMAMVGLTALAGVVVNDAIVLVDFVNQARLGGRRRFRSIIEGGSRRFRPIILTTVTTVAGLVPLAYGFGGASSFLSPMALAIIYGLSYATMLTLFLVPCLIAITDDIKKRLFHETVD